MYRILFKCLREYKKEAILAPLCIFFEVIFECAIPFLANLLITELQDNGDKVKNGQLNTFIILSVALVVCALCGLIAGFMSARFAAKAASGFAKNIRHDMYYKIQDFSFENIDRFSASSLVTRMTTDVTNIQMAFGMLIRACIRSPFMVIFSVIMCFVINVKLGLIFLVMVPIVALAFFIIAKFAMPIFSKVFEKYDALNESVQENIDGIRVVKNYVREDYEMEKFCKASDNLKKGLTKAERIVALNGPVMTFSINVAVFSAAILGAYMITSSNGSEMGIGGLQSLIQYGIQILMALMFLSMVSVMIILSIASAKRIAEVLEEAPTITNPENPVMEVSDGSIEFKNVSFKYSSLAQRNALDNINIKIESGMTIGIIGSTGSAKTSFVNLISRLYDVTEGELLVGGLNVKNYDVKVLRDEVSVVLQKNVLFSGTIAENLRWGNKNATQEEIEAACHSACADEFIDKMPNRYETYIEQGGTNVSGGQKQRLCIARALLKKPKILILDDSTSAVDTKTDSIIREGLKNSLPNTTKIIIAQRLASIENSDLIIVMDDGKINGIGTNKELLETNNIYKEIHEIQNRISSQEKEMK